MTVLPHSGVAAAISLNAPDEPAADAVCMPAREGIFTLPEILTLHFGGQLAGARVAWRLAGHGSRIVAALGGISAGRYVTGASPKGWWSEVVGPGCALDTQRCQVLAFDFLGGSGDTTGPQPGDSRFPAVSAYDQAYLLRALMAHLGIPKLHSIAGASYGGMVALAFAERWPQHVQHIVVISAADRTHPLATAWRSVQRAMVRYAIQHNDAAEGLRLARALAMATYRSADEFAQRFAGNPVRVEGRFQFPIEAYLLARGDAYAASYVPEAFVCLSESIDLHSIDATSISVPTTLVAIREDQLVPLADVRAMHRRLGGPAELIELSSLYGHDAFLKESAALRAVFARVLGWDSPSSDPR